MPEEFYAYPGVQHKCSFLQMAGAYPHAFNGCSTDSEPYERGCRPAGTPVPVGKDHSADIKVYGQVVIFPAEGACHSL